jgi:hypothetical protein
MDGRNESGARRLIGALNVERNYKYRETALWFMVLSHGEQWDLHSARGGPNSWDLHHVSKAIYKVRVRHPQIVVIKPSGAEDHWNGPADVLNWFNKFEKAYLKVQARKRAA